MPTRPQLALTMLEHYSELWKSLRKQPVEEMWSNCRQLAQVKITTAQWMEYLDVVAPLPAEIDPDYTERRFKSIERTRQSIIHNYRVSPPQQVESIRETAWSAYNAVSQLIDHMPRRGVNERARAETRFNVTQRGAGHHLKERAFDSACKLAGITAEA